MSDIVGKERKQGSVKGDSKDKKEDSFSTQSENKEKEVPPPNPDFRMSSGSGVNLKGENREELVGKTFMFDDETKKFSVEMTAVNAGFTVDE